MALSEPAEDGSNRRESDTDIQKRFGIAQDGRPSPRELEVQNQLRDLIASAGFLLNNEVSDSPAKSTALSKLKEALMWGGSAIFEK